jgi:hypothetical protein
MVAIGYFEEGLVFLVCIFDHVNFQIEFAVGSNLVLVFLRDPVHDGRVIFGVVEEHRGEDPFNLVTFVFMFVFLCR